MALSILLTGCFGSDDNGGSNDDGPNDPTPTTNLVQGEYGPGSRNVQYEYNEADDLETWTSTFTTTTGFELGFSYDDSGNVLSISYIDSDDQSGVTSFTYDFEGHLLGYVGFGESVAFDWDGNTVTVTGTIQGNDNASAVLELDGMGRVIQFTENDQYTTFLYDSNGNLTNAFRFDLDDNLLNEFSLIYDGNNNPFYGQLESIYLERFIEYFWEFDGILYTGIEGYNFPYSPNNVLRIDRDGSTAIAYSYGYNSNDYPTIISEIINGSSYQYNLEYY